MKPISIQLKSIFAVFTLSLATTSAQAQFSASTGFDYNSGKYGLDTKTDIFTWNLTGEYSYAGRTAKIVAPVSLNRTRAIERRFATKEESTK
jgi:hypothetical protein